MLTLISCGVKKSDVTDFSLDIIKKADMIVGGRRLLDFFYTPNAEKIILDKELIQSLNSFVKHNINSNVVFLASGDSLFNGLGKRLTEIAGIGNITIIPNITAMQALFAKLCLPWQDARFFSIHGKEKILPYHNILHSKLSVIYCDNQMTASQAAEQLIKLYPYCSERKAVIAENISAENECITVDNLKTLAQKTASTLSMLLVLPSDNQNIYDPGIPIGISDDEFEKENNCITHSEIRAIALSKLKLGNGVMWDLGAGSGSVGIEAASISPFLEVFSVEKNQHRCESISVNRQKFGCSNLKILQKHILDALPGLPAPRSVFIGGGGDEVAEVLEKTFNILIPGGRIVVTSVLLETTSTLLTTLEDYCIEVLAVSINRAVPLAGKKLMKSDNSITIFIYEKPYEYK